jgi:hypothetical protein
MSRGSRRTVGALAIVLGLALVVPEAVYWYLTTMAHVVGIDPRWLPSVFWAMTFIGIALALIGIRAIRRARI